MSRTIHRVIIVGGTGLLGYHAGIEFLKRGYEVTALALADIDLEGWFPEEISVIHGDVFAMKADELVSAFRDFDAMVYAVGPDDRTVPSFPAEAFFREKLVEQSTRIFACARRAGVRRAVLLNSYFAHFNRHWPDLRLAARHTYINARVEQASGAIGASEPGMATMVLELPYIFGTMPQRVPLWKEVFLQRMLKMNPVFYPEGGSAMMRVENVAEAIAGAVENGEHGTRYVIGDLNLRWNEMLGIMFGAIGVQRRVLRLPGWMAMITGSIIRFMDRIKGREAGLHLKYVFADIISREFYVNPKSSAAVLGYGSGDVRKAIAASALACYPMGYRRRKRSHDQ